MKKTALSIIAGIIAVTGFAQIHPAVSKKIEDSAKARFQENTHKVVLDNQSKIISWITPQSKAYDQFLHQRWNFIKTMVPNSPGPAPRSLYPQYYFYCAYRPKDGGLEPDTWMNDIGEKIPNWFESARLYYAYTGDSTVMTIIKNFVDYSLEHGTSPADFSWPNFPYTTTNAGDTEFRGFTSGKRFSLHEIQVDHAGDIGLTYYRLYQYTGDKKYLKAATNVANTLAAKVRVGSATHSPWPYLVIMTTGQATAEYGANWASCYQLLDNLADAGIGNVVAYRNACKKVKDFILEYPMKTGYWTDGHSDVAIRSNTYKSNMSASNMKLFMLDYPEFNPGWKKDVPRLIKWTEDYFVHRGDSSEPGTMWGANIVGEQDDFLYKMDYQTARYAAECARWYTISGDESYKEKAYRSLNWVTYCNDSNGMAFESPLSKGISNWWSDCYGECPRMFYHALAAVPEWAPSQENHILYSRDVLKNVSYHPEKIEYTATGKNGTESLRLAFKPSKITVNGTRISLKSDSNKQGYLITRIINGDYSVKIFRNASGRVIISAGDGASEQFNLKIDGSKKIQRIDGIGVNVNTRSWNGKELEPAVKLMHDSMNANIWRVLVETVEKWEEENDNNDPFTFNWDYYDKLYETPKFQKAWNMIGYLNKRGITDNLMINFMGVVPKWMGEEVVKPEFEDEYVEMLVSFFYYAVKKRNLKFGLVSHMNEPDIRKEGPTVNPRQYADIFAKLIKRMQAVGLGHIRYVGPDVAGMNAGIKDYAPLMMKDTTIMNNLAHIGLHSYSGYYAPVDSTLKKSAYPESSFWITEWNEWCNGCDDGKVGTYDFNYAGKSVKHLIDLLQNGASAGIVWEGFDSYYEHHAPSLFSYWGVLKYNPETKTYTPRKHFYTISQISRFITPGSVRIGSSASSKDFLIIAMQDSLKRVSLVGINLKNKKVTVNGSLENLEGVNRFQMSHTTESVNLQKDKDVKVNGKKFTVTIPANSIFALRSYKP